MPVLMVRSKIKPENAADAEAAINRVFSAIEQAQPAGRPLRVEQARRRRQLRGAVGA